VDIDVCSEFNYLINIITNFCMWNIVQTHDYDTMLNY
jgi:hypothetical protein